MPNAHASADAPKLDAMGEIAKSTVLHKAEFSFR
jgi:hypothetical protein